MAHLQISSQEALDAWLKNEPLQWAQVLAIRAALRCLPLVEHQVRRSDLTVAAFRALFVSWAATRLPSENSEYVFAARMAAIRAASARGRQVTAATYAVGAAASCSYAIADTSRASAYSSDAVKCAAQAVANVVHENAAYAENAEYAAEHVWRVVTKEAGWLVKSTEEKPAFRQFAARQVLNRTLWDGNISAWAEQGWREMVIRHAREPNWKPWIEWYEGRLNGRTSGFELPTEADEIFCTSLALESDEFWDQSPEEVNSHIADRLIAAKEATCPPNIPIQKPAPVITFARNGKIALQTPDPPIPVAAEKEIRRTKGHLAMKRALESFIRSGAAHNNCPGLIDAITSMQDSLGETLKEMEVIEVGALGERINQYAMRADDIFPSETAAEVVAININLKRQMAHFDEWVNFVEPLKNGLPQRPEMTRIIMEVATHTICSNALENETKIKLERVVHIATSDEFAAEPGPIESMSLEISLCNTFATAAEIAVNEKIGIDKKTMDKINDGLGESVKDGTKYLAKELFIESTKWLSELAAHSPHWAWIPAVLRFLKII